jgi:hypothetical protein
MFVKENTRLSLINQRDIHTSIFYEMTLKQQWVRIFSCNSNDVSGDFVYVDVNVETEVVDVIGTETHCAK